MARRSSARTTGGHWRGRAAASGARPSSTYSWASPPPLSPDAPDFTRWGWLQDHPRLSPILEQLFAGEHHRADPSPRNPAFRLDHLNVHTHDAFPPSHLRGGNLHGGNNDLLREGSPDANPCRYFHKGADGRYSNGLVTVAYELYDTHCNGGGFGCLAYAHNPFCPLSSRWEAKSNASGKFKRQASCANAPSPEM